VLLSEFVEPHSGRFPTFDRQEGHAREIPVYLYEPTKPGIHPAMIWMSSGPGEQFRPTYSPIIQYLVNELGFVVVAPNLRGTHGYGRAYQTLVDGALREDAIKDFGALLVWLSGQNSIDTKHLFVSGDSYGGYLALAALENYGDRLQGGIIQGAIADFPAYLSTSAPYNRARLRAILGDEHDPDRRTYLRHISPLTTIDRVNRPVLMVQGRNDAEVPLAMTQPLLSSLRSKNIDVWYLQANNEGHCFTRQRNREVYLDVVTQFLEHVLHP